MLQDQELLGQSGIFAVQVIPALLQSKNKV
jgi:hypothetical protein